MNDLDVILIKLKRSNRWSINHEFKVKDETYVSLFGLSYNRFDIIEQSFLRSDLDKLVKLGRVTYTKEKRLVENYIKIPFTPAEMDIEYWSVVK